MGAWGYRENSVSGYRKVAEGGVMGQTTGISWTDHTLLCGVLFLVAAFTQRLAVADDQSQFWMRSERFQVVRMEISAAGIATALASKPIAREYIKTPASILSAKPNTFALRRLAVLIEAASWATRRGSSYRFTMRLSSFRRHLASPQFAYESMATTHFGAIAEMATLHFRRRSLLVAPPLAACQAMNAAVGAAVIGAADILIEFVNASPCLAATAPFLASRAMLAVCLDGYTEEFGSDCHSAFERISHHFILIPHWRK